MDYFTSDEYLTAKDLEALIESYWGETHIAQADAKSLLQAHNMQHLLEAVQKEGDDAVLGIVNRADLQPRGRA